MTLDEMQDFLSEEEKAKGLLLIQQGILKSAQCYDENHYSVEYEALFYDETRVWLPTIEFDYNRTILDHHCQCCEDSYFCEHKVALLLLIQEILSLTGDNFEELLVEAAKNLAA